MLFSQETGYRIKDIQPEREAVIARVAVERTKGKASPQVSKKE